MPKRPLQYEIPQWFIKFRLRNGVERCYPISTSEKDELWDRLEKIYDRDRVHDKGKATFWEFESKTHRILIQTSQLMFVHFLFEPFPLNSNEEDYGGSYPVKISFVNSPDPLVLHVYADEPDPQDEGDEGEVSNFLFYALLAHDEELLNLTDQDGETAFFLASSIALIEVPLEVFEPEIMTDEETDEEVEK